MTFRSHLGTSLSPPKGSGLHRKGSRQFTAPAFIWDKKKKRTIVALNFLAARRYSSTGPWASTHLIFFGPGSAIFAAQVGVYCGLTRPQLAWFHRSR